MPLIGMWRRRKQCNSSWPASSSPITPTGSTLTPRSARLQMALAPPPGAMLRSRCFRMSTGASRETRAISPKTNSSATRSARTVAVSRLKLSTMRSKRCCCESPCADLRAGFAADWGAFFTNAAVQELAHNFLTKRGYGELNRLGERCDGRNLCRPLRAALGQRAQQQIKRPSSRLQSNLQFRDGQRLKLLRQRAEIHTVLFCG